MKIELIQVKEFTIAEIISDEVLIQETQDALDIMAEAGYHGAGRMILYEKNITPSFFDLKTGIAGDILQKFSNYRVQLAIIGDFSKFKGKSLKDFIFESNRQGHICFVGSLEEAMACLVKA